MKLNYVLTIFLVTAALLLSGCELFQGPPGADGLPGGDGSSLVGGTFNCTIQLPSIPPEAVFFLAFDTDNLIDNGNEIVIRFPVGEIASSNLNYGTSWFTDQVTPGEYYVYGWYSSDEDPAFKTGQTAELYFIYLGNTTYADYSIQSDPDRLEAGPSGILKPNFSVGDAFAPQLDIVIEYFT